MNDRAPSEPRKTRRPPGRKPGVRNLSPEELDAFIERVLAGDSVEGACGVIGRSKPALYGRAKRDPAFAARWKDAESSVDLRLDDFLCGLREGLTLSAAARLARVSERQVHRRLEEDPAFREQVQAARAPLQVEAEKALLRQALGTPERPAEYDEEGREVLPYQPGEKGDPAQLRFLLRNRYSSEWNEGRFKG